MTKKEFVNKVREKSEHSKAEIEEMLDTILDTIVDCVSDGEKIIFKDFGFFESKISAARIGRNPKTGEIVEIPESKKPVFKAGKLFKDKVNRT